jgi:hypothetical protein
VRHDLFRSGSSWGDPGSSVSLRAEGVELDRLEPREAAAVATELASVLEQVVAQEGCDQRPAGEQPLLVELGHRGIEQLIDDRIGQRPSTG